MAMLAGSTSLMVNLLSGISWNVLLLGRLSCIHSTSTTRELHDVHVDLMYTRGL